MCNSNRQPICSMQIICPRNRREYLAHLIQNRFKRQIPYYDDQPRDPLSHGQGVKETLSLFGYFFVYIIAMIL